LARHLQSICLDALTNLDYERKRDCFARPICPLHLVIACVQAVGALYDFVFFPASSWISSYCCLDPLLLPWACHLDPIFIPHFCSGGYLNFDRAFLDRTRQQGRGVCIYTTAGICNGEHLHPSVHHLFHRNIPRDIIEPSGVTDLQYWLRTYYRYSCMYPGMEPNLEWNFLDSIPLQFFPTWISNFPWIPNGRLLKLLLDLCSSFESHSCFSIHSKSCPA